MRTGARAIVLHRDHVLMGLRRDGLWEWPGGKLRERETAMAGARRELEEETGLLLPARPTFLGYVDLPRRVELIFLWPEEELHGGLTAPQPREHNHVQWKWFPIDGLPAELTESCRYSLDYLRD